jgi:hypothetical protein
MPPTAHDAPPSSDHQQDRSHDQAHNPKGNEQASKPLAWLQRELDLWSLPGAAQLPARRREHAAHDFRQLIFRVNLASIPGGISRSPRTA